jgi:hypothetical protein
VLNFLSNISQTKTYVWGPNRTFFHYLRPKKGGGQKCVVSRIYEVKG